MIVGGAQETVLLAAALADLERFDPVVVTGPQTGSEGSLHGELAERGVRVIVLPELVRQVDPWADVASLGSLTRTFQQEDVDVVHTSSSKAGILGRLAARRARVPTVLHTIHGWPFHDRQAAPVSAVWRTLERRCAPLAHHLVVVAEADRVKGLAAGVGRPKQYVTVRSGLELERYGADPATRARVRASLGLEPSAFVIAAVNRLSPQKDPLGLVRGLCPVLKQDSASRLLIVGDGPLRADVKRLIAELGLGRQVMLTGLRSDVADLLTAADVFVSASLWEGLPRTVIQAMATDLPVVATAADGIVDIVNDEVTGLLVPRADAPAMAAAVRRLRDDLKLRVRVTTAAAARLPEFDATTMVRRLEKLYAGTPP